MKGLLRQKIANLSPVIMFLPLLVFYCCLVRFSFTTEMDGDEGRYVMFARNLLSGFYSPPAPHINLWNGPAYPLFLVPFIALGISKLYIVMANAVLHYLSIVFVFYTLNRYLSRKRSIAISLMWGCYYLAYQDMPNILSETLAIFLVSAFLILFSKAHHDGGSGYAIGAGIVFGLLILTKVIFGYVMLFVGLATIVMAVCLKSVQIQTTAVMLLVALCVTLPYQAYTYGLTGRLFYLANSGGLSLYWMSTPYAGEFGEWNNDTFTANCVMKDVPCNSEYIAKNHKKFFDDIRGLAPVERDDALKRIALSNIRDHPFKYLKNCVNNFSRILFNIPHSYVYQREQTIARLLPNSIVLTAMLFAGYLTVRFRKWLPSELKWLALCVTVYIGMSVLVSAYPRHFYVVMPMVVVWVAVVVDRFVHIGLRESLVRST